MIECVKLQRLYPRVLNEAFIWEVPEGWELLMEDFIEEMNEAAKEFRQGSVRIIHIKPRFGQMRVYIDYKLPDEQMMDFEKIASKYEKLSLKICSFCGSIDRPIHKNIGFPTNTICERCFEDHNGN